MRSWLRTCFTLAAVLLVGCLVGAAVLGVIERHLEEHRHDRAGTALDIEQAQRAEAQAGREAEQGGGGGHVFIFARGSLSTHLNSVAR